jgi:hypothetical protein
VPCSQLSLWFSIEREDRREQAAKPEPRLWEIITHSTTSKKSSSDQNLIPYPHTIPVTLEEKSF